MIDGIDSAAAGLEAYAKTQEVIARNLANANTTGFKRDIIDFATVLTEVNGVQQTSFQGNLSTDFSKGKLIYTGNSLDIAIDGDGFFTLETEQGLRYTRNGQFQLSTNGEVVTSSGAKLMEKGGPLQIPKQGGEIIIDSKGTVKVNNKVIGELLISKFKDPSDLAPTGGSSFSAPLTSLNLDKEVDFKVAQGYLESSNVNVVVEMVDMIANTRSYEASNNILKTLNETIERLIRIQSTSI